MAFRFRESFFLNANVCVCMHVGVCVCVVGGGGVGGVGGWHHITFHPLDCRYAIRFELQCHSPGLAVNYFNYLLYHSTFSYIYWRVNFWLPW